MLIVTYLNASVDTFRARIRKRLDEMDLQSVGFDVRTLHSLALEIVRLAAGGFGDDHDGPDVLDEIRSNDALATAVTRTIEDNPAQWLQFLEDDSPQMRARWRDITERTARTFIRTAKNERYTPEMIQERLKNKGGVPSLSQDSRLSSADDTLQSSIFESPLLHMMAAIYSRYQQALIRQGALDFDDLIWQAVDLLQNRPDFAAELRQRWPYVLEDEAQDSVPLQEALLTSLTGPQGNWVRVGDPNQAITSTFTAAHPRFFNAFSDRPDVLSLPLPNSGRSSAHPRRGQYHARLGDRQAPPLKKCAATPSAANTSCPPHPATPSPIRPTAKPPSASKYTNIAKMKNYRPSPAWPTNTAPPTPHHTLAILVPTNQTGYLLADHLDELGANYDNLLRGGSREREIAAAIHAVLALLAEPLNTKALVTAHAALHELEHPAAACPAEELPRLHTILRSVYQPEALLFPADGADLEAALPAGVADEDDIRAIGRFTAFVRRLFDLRTLPIDDLTLSLGDELFARGEVHEVDLAIAYQDRRHLTPLARRPPGMAAAGTGGAVGGGSARPPPSAHHRPRRPGL
ncbi:MAG: UvrD-helicase domain-containing protein [Chloroflexi bacterium]|nr:UvrD-helicase domain-containing protein [Chloroflexota bacterium]